MPINSERPATTFGAASPLIQGLSAAEQAQSAEVFFENFQWEPQPEVEELNAEDFMALLS